MNYNGPISIHESIYDRPHYISTITSFNKVFEVGYVKKSDKIATNPYFPSIHIALRESHNAWIQIVHTDSSIKKYKNFIDSCKDIYPFYTKEQDFYDSPIWQYTLLVKPVTCWRGHAYALKIDYDSRIIKILGGIKWGYTLSYFRIHPQMILPSGLKVEDLEIDKEIIEKELPGFKFIL